MSGGWNFAEIWERIADKFPDAQAQVQGDRRFTWAEFDRRADGVARTLLDRGAAHQDKVALYLYNGPEYMETAFACYKASLVPVNTNYRYIDDELTYLWDNADAMAVVFHGEFTETIERIRARVPKVKVWLWVDDGNGSCPEWATPYEDAVATETGRVVGPNGRSGDDILMIYTGGTTGMPKGVMWRQDDLIHATCTTGLPILAGEESEVGYDAVLEAIAEPGAPGLPACPLMHGTGWFTANIFLVQGGSIVSLVHRHFDVAEILDTIEREKVGAITIVGDSFAKPIVAALDAEPTRWDLSSLVLVTSSGVMWSEPVKAAMLAHHPGMLLIDVFSSSEAIGLGQSISAAGGGATGFVSKNVGVNWDVRMFRSLRSQQPVTGLVVQQGKLSFWRASMGFAIPAAIGVQIANKELRPLVVVGDGAFQMTSMELSTAVRHKLNPIVVVLNNKGYTTERFLQEGPFNDIQNWNYHRLPDLLGGGWGFEVHTMGDLKQSMQAALAHRDAFSVLNVHLDKLDVSPALQRLAARLSKRI